MQALKKTVGTLNRWPYPVRAHAPTGTYIAATTNKDWMMFKLSLKGLPTGEQLVLLQEYYIKHINHKVPTSVVESIKMRVDSYIHSLRRHGKLADVKGKKNVVVQ